MINKGFIVNAEEMYYVAVGGKLVFWNGQPNGEMFRVRGAVYMSGELFLTMDIDGE